MEKRNSCHCIEKMGGTVFDLIEKTLCFVKKLLYLQSE